MVSAIRVGVPSLSHGTARQSTWLEAEPDAGGRQDGEAFVRLDQETRKLRGGVVIELGLVAHGIVAVEEVDDFRVDRPAAGEAARKDGTP